VPSNPETPQRQQEVPRPRHVEPVALGELRGPARAELAGAAVPVRGVTADSRSVRVGDLFAALPGRQGHGIAHLAQASAAGATAVLTDPAGAAAMDAGDRHSLPALVTADPRAVLGAVSARVYGDPSKRLPVFGVTGTSGKTTTTSLVRAGLAAAGVRSGMVGTTGVYLDGEQLPIPFTTPEAPQLQALLAVMIERGMSCAELEVSSHALRLGRVDGVDFAVGAFTNLSQDHLDFHSDMQDYFEAKSLLFDGRARREVVVTDQDWGRRLVRAQTVTVSTTSRDADWFAEGVRLRADGSTTFTVRGGGQAFAAGCRIPGEFNVANALLAFAILAEAGVDPAAVAPAVGQAQVRGRMQRVDAGQPFLAVVDYSHKPAGVAVALQALRPLTTGRLIIVLGCGGDRDAGKRPVMGETASRHADVLIVTDDNPRAEDPAAIRAAMLAGARSAPAAESAEVVEEGDRHAAIARAVGIAGPGDTVLVAGKGHETYQQVGAAMLPFDDVSVLEEALASRGFSSTRPRPGVSQPEPGPSAPGDRPVNRT